MLRISLYNVSAQKRRLTQIFADYYSNYLFLICANLRKSVFLIISFYFAYLLISPFLRIYTASAVAVYIHRQLQYIFISSCSIYSTADAVYIHFSGVLSCMFCSACCAFGAMRFWPPLMMQTNWGLPARGACLSHRGTPWALSGGGSTSRARGRRCGFHSGIPERRLSA